jgi:flavin-dependent thymidylate synthase
MPLEKVVLDPGPRVVLRNWFNKPFDDAIAAARTCYSSRVVSAEEVTEQQRVRISKATYEGGHHSIWQHATFEFAIEGISRNLVHELHSHPFYNTSQSSQRYVKLKEIRATIPPLEGKNLRLYEDTIIRAWEKYEELTEIILKRLIELQPKTPTEREVKVLEKKAIETARYVIPIAAHTSMVHTINGLTLFRLNKLRMSGNTPWESNVVIAKMVEEVKKIDPLFFERFEDPLPLKETLEYKFYEKYKNFVSEKVAEEFDKSLEGYRSKLVDWKVNGEKVMADAVRHVMNVSGISDEEALDFVLNPAKNHYLTERLNLSTLSPLMRTMNHPHFTFRKKMSHTADSQDQRHRMTPASRPMMIFVDSRKPDYITPTFIEENKEMKKIYDGWMKEVWEVKNLLLDNGVKREFAMYVLPNALAVRFEESGSLLNLWHKWVMRLCTRAQREIWEVSREEVEQVRKVQPNLVKHIGPKCVLRKKAGIKPYCPEGALTCGFPVWDTYPEMEYVG